MQNYTRTHSTVRSDQKVLLEMLIKDHEKRKRKGRSYKTDETLNIKNINQKRLATGYHC